MNFFINILSVFLLVSIFFSCTQNEEEIKHNKKQEILNLEKLRIEALLGNDIELLKEIMHPEAIHISTDGNRTTTEEWLEGRRNSIEHFETFILTNDPLIRFYDNIAIIDGSYTNSKRINDSVTPIKNARYTRVYINTPNKGWKMITHQATKINE